MSDSPVVAVDDFLTVGQAAAFLGVSPWTLRNWDRTGKLKSQRHASNGYRIYRRGELASLGKPIPVMKLGERLSPRIDWTEFGDSEHMVQFYEQDSYLEEGVVGYIAAALEAGDSGLIIATPAHRSGIARRLRDKGFDVSRGGSLMREGRLAMLDAGEMLAMLMADGMPDRARFEEVLGGAMGRASEGGRSVRAFGEMVSLLWVEGNQRAAIALEELWNELGKRCQFSLLCAYSIGHFGGEEASFNHVCGQHSRVIPAESYSAAQTPEARLRVISSLQHRSKLLEKEIERRRQAEEALARRERELSDFLDNAVEGLHKVGPDGTILWANKAELDLLGYSEAEYIGHSIWEFHADRDVIDAMLVRLQRGDALRDHPARLRARDGSIKYVLISSNAYIEGGRFIYTRCFTRDITSRRYLEIQHGELHNRLAAIVESSDDAIISKTLDGIVRTWNRVAQRIFGYTAEEAIGKPIDRLIIPDDRMEEEPRILKRLAAGQRVDHFETVRRTKGGRLIDISATISPVRNDRGEIIGASKIARDITQQKQMTAELKAAKETAEEATKAKDHFLGVLSHELRTPLTPALAELSYLETDRALGPEIQDQIKMVRRNVETQARLVDDLLDVTRISRGKLSLHFEVVDVHELLSNVMTMFQPQIQAKGIEFTGRLGAGRHYIWADPGRMQQVFLNLMSNAVKFTRPDGLIRVETGNDTENRIQIQVVDNGSGIEADLLPRLFTPFEQAPQSRRFGGLGLGLSIVQSLVTMHQGTIRATSEGKDRGAAFTVDLATVVPVRGASSAEPAQRFTSTYRILLVEDHVDTRTVLTRLLTSFGHEVKAASTIQEALEAARSGRFELMMSDLGLPDGSGLELIAQIRKFSDMRAIALSGFGLDEDIERSRCAGFTMHLTKPINIQLLCEIIQKTME